MLSLSGHKIQAPQGIGALVLKRKNYKRPPIKPLFWGGQQEYGFRPGTLPVPLIAGLSYAALLYENEHNSQITEAKAVREQFFDAIKNLRYVINGDSNYCLPNIVNISFTGVDAESVFTALKGEYAFSNGSACTSNSYSPSHVLTAMGLCNDVINQALRISWGRNTDICFKELVEYINSVA